MKKSKMKRKNKIALVAFSLVWVISLASIATYSWIARNWTPSLEYSEITIATSGALVISIEDKNGDPNTFNEVNLNTFSGIESFTLKQVSSSNGRSFVGADFSPVISGGVPVYTQEVDGKYIEVEFYLKAQPYQDTSLKNVKKVFLHPDTTIEFLEETSSSDSTEQSSVSASEEASSDVNNEPTADVEKAIRMSVDAVGFNNDLPYILCKERGTADGEDLIYQQLKAAATNTYSDVIGKEIYTESYPDAEILNESLLSPQLAYDYKYFDGTSDDKCLFTIDQDTHQLVTLRIWLEGCDENCVSEIAGKSLKVILKFDCIDVPQE